jgi:serine protease Do
MRTMPGFNVREELERPRRSRLTEQTDITDPNFIPNEFGAGIVLREDGLILTNYHLVRGGPIEGKPEQASDQILYVRTTDRQWFEAQIHAADPRSDLAVLKVDVSGRNLKPIKRGNGAGLNKGQIVIALGNPYAIARDGSPSATWGIIGNISRKAITEPDATEDGPGYRRETIHHLGTLVQVDTRLELGTSGGALLNLRGELIGITTSLAALAGYEKSSGFAIPFDDAMKRIVDTLIEGKEVEYGFLGIEPTDVRREELTGPFENAVRRLNQFGMARANTVFRNSPAENGQMVSGDLIVSVNDKPIYSKIDLMREIGLHAPGDVVRMRVWRPLAGAGMPHDIQLNVTVGKWPAVDEENIITTKPLFEPWRGLVVDYATARHRHLPMSFRGFGVEIPDAVLITEVKAGTPASHVLDLKPGEFITRVNGRPVHSPQDFYAAVKAESGPVVLSLRNSSPNFRTGSTAPPRQVEIRP